MIRDTEVIEYRFCGMQCCARGIIQISRIKHYHRGAMNYVRGALSYARRAMLYERRAMSYERRAMLYEHQA